MEEYGRLNDDGLMMFAKPLRVDWNNKFIMLRYINAKRIMEKML